MPAIVDHKERRARLAEAVWALIAREGIAAASVRGVAREAGYSMGSIRHFFGTQSELRQFAMHEVIVRARQRVESLHEERAALRDDGSGVEAAATMLEQVLPLDEERLTEARVWMTLSMHGSQDTEMMAIRHEADGEVRGMCRTALVGLVAQGCAPPDLDLDVETERLWSLVGGLTTHIVLNPELTSPHVATAVLRTHLVSLDPDANRHGGPASSDERSLTQVR